MPVMRAVGIPLMSQWVSSSARRLRRAREGAEKKGSPIAPLSPWSGSARRATSRDPRASRRPLDLAGVEAAGAHLDLLDLAVHEDPRDLEVGLPDASRLVVGVRDVVPEGDALAAHVAASVVHGQLSISSMRAISAPSPLR